MYAPLATKMWTWVRHFIEVVVGWVGCAPEVGPWVHALFIWVMETLGTFWLSSSKSSIHVGLTWWLVLIKHSHLSGKWEGLYLRMDIKEIRVTMSFDYVYKPYLNHSNYSRCNNKYNWKSLYDHFKSREIFTLEFYNFCMDTTLIMKLEMTTFLIKGDNSWFDSMAKIATWSWKSPQPS